MENCPNCDSKISTSIFNENLPLSDNEVKLVNRFTDNSSEGYCQKCNDKNKLLNQANKSFFTLKNELTILKNNQIEKLGKISVNIPISTLQNPQDWKYKSIEMVSAQMVSGTGIISEIASNWTDFFGTDSGYYNEKIKSAEEKCKSILRAEVIKIGGNAILGTDIDYSEAGAGKGMLMVCMAGTAVKITNLDELDYNKEALEEIDSLLKAIDETQLKIQELSEFKVPA
ncbi:heavy metal-binding domain-containing protein [Algoriphagus sp. C2-6-M1]|uniref:heavy metal-binding domain-containing protein n=1 Tax=Algoriphagus persicinus TaxID=3108754 RepID=UPI002B3F45E4|nr:heavy metal-binding domain-containing protein [Algoriphagus sp. C2-6-M1]MEB2779986.1 heavy metal-binding domain-containing protein [Algoriphagus sp. C2-6-M1]